MDHTTLAGTFSGAVVGIGCHIKGIVASITLAQVIGVIPEATIVSTIVVASIGAVTGFIITTLCKYSLTIIKRWYYNRKIKK